MAQTEKSTIALGDRPEGRKRAKRVGFMVAIGFLAVLVVIAIAAPLFAPHDPLEQNLRGILAGPSPSHPLGTDHLGRDILSRIFYGARPTLITSVAATVIAATVGITLGMVSGYFGSWTDSIIMRMMDFLLAMPAVLLALVVIVTLNPGSTSAMLAVAVVGIPQFARMSRSQVLSLRTREFVLASKAVGASTPRLLFRVLLPNAAGPLVAQAVVIAALAVFLEAALSFLGLGVPPPEPSWGQMVSAGKSYLQSNPGYALFPGVAIAATILALDMVANGLRSVFAGEDAELSELSGKAA
ncbi:MAG: ABC transporter permease [Actinomycetota bacterium]|nr:ABC transporter permease [Actinomycetota bacterium]